MSWAAAARLGMAEGDALALAREAGQLRGHLNNYILSKWAQDSLVMILLEEIEDIANGKREAHFFGDMANKDARNAFRTRYFEIVRARDDGKVDLPSIDLSEAETRDLATVIAKKFARPSAQIRNTPVVGLTPLDAARKALADARANAFGGLVIEHVLMNFESTASAWLMALRQAIPDAESKPDFDTLISEIEAFEAWAKAELKSISDMAMHEAVQGGVEDLLSDPIAAKAFRELAKRLRPPDPM